MIGLRRKNIMTYLTPDDHMMCMWQRNYVLRVDNWKKQWSGCSKTLQITAQSSNSIGHRLRWSLLGTWTVCPPPPETPIRDVVDHCRVWESHADPAVHRVSKPSPDPTYPAYVVGDADRTSGTTRVAAVTGQRSGTNQLEDLLRRLLTTVESPARSRRCLQWKSYYSDW